MNIGKWQVFALCTFDRCKPGGVERQADVADVIETNASGWPAALAPGRTHALVLDSSRRARQHGGMTETIARLHIALADTDPLIWRRVEVPVEASLKMLHDIIQGAMGWLDCHLWEFKADDKRYGLPDPGWADDSLFAARNIKLKSLLDRGISQLTYTYDMGDNWEHIVTVETAEAGHPDTGYPRYVDGERRVPLEDIGGPPGFEDFLDAIAKPKSRGHKDAVEWHRGCYGEDFVPDQINERVAKLRIGEIAKRRAAGKSAYAKRQSSSSRLRT